MVYIYEIAKHFRPTPKKLLIEEPRDLFRNDNWVGTAYWFLAKLEEEPKVIRNLKAEKPYIEDINQTIEYLVNQFTKNRKDYEVAELQNHFKLIGENIAVCLQSKSHEVLINTAFIGLLKDIPYSMDFWVENPKRPVFATANIGHNQEVVGVFMPIRE